MDVKIVRNPGLSAGDVEPKVSLVKGVLRVEGRAEVDLPGVDLSAVEVSRSGGTLSLESAEPSEVRVRFEGAVELVAPKGEFLRISDISTGPAKQGR